MFKRRRLKLFSVFCIFILYAVNGVPLHAAAAPVIAVNCGGTAIGSFMADSYFSGGTPVSYIKTIDTSGMSNPAPQEIYQSERWGEFTYMLSNLTAGANYLVRLHFAEIYFNSAGLRKFNVVLNGAQALNDFDIVAAAGAANKATMQQFPVTANSAGQIVIQFTAGSVDAPKCSGIEVYQNPISMTVKPSIEFSANSFAHKPLSDNAALDPKSAIWVASLQSQITKYYGVANVNYRQYAPTIFVVPANQPTVRVKAWDKNNASWSFAPLQAKWDVVPLPTDFQASLGTDQEAVVYQPSTGKVWEFWLMAKTGTKITNSAGQLVDEWGARWGGRIDTVSSNPGYFITENGDWYTTTGVKYGTTATSLSFLAGTMTIEEQRLGVVDHTVGIALPETLAYPVWSFPANRSDGKVQNADAIPQGTTFRLPANLDLDAITMDPYARMIAKAVQKHGMVVWDTAGAVSFRAENPADRFAPGEDPYTKLGGILNCPTGVSTPVCWADSNGRLKGFPWDKLQALKSILNTNPFPDTTAPSVPQNNKATVISTSQINLGWDASTDNVGVAEYRVYRNGTQIGITQAISYSDTGLTPSTAYTYTIAAIDAAGNLSTQSTAANATTQAAADTTVPSTPTNLSASAISSSQINLTWTASTDNVGVTGYKVLRGGVQVATSTSNSFSDTGLSPSTSYTYTVRAFDAANNVSAQSASISAVTQSPPVVLPPTLSVGLTAVPLSGTVPLNNITLTATVGGTATGHITYTFYCNRSDQGTNITLPFSGQATDQVLTAYTLMDFCSYTTPGAYSIKVIAERGGLSAQAQADILATAVVPVSNPVPPSENVNPPSSNSSGGGGGGGSYYTNPTPVTIPPSVPKTTTPPVTSTTGNSNSGSVSPLPLMNGPFIIGVRSNQIKLLQQMLANPAIGGPDIFSAVPTGYYGPLTVKAVQIFQVKYNIVSYGSPETTGYGFVGKRTLAKLNALINERNKNGGIGGNTVPANVATEVQKQVLQNQIDQLRITVQQLLSELLKIGK